jgi:hypothetical protein
MPDILNTDSLLRPSRHVRATITEHGGMLLDLRHRRGRWYALTPTAAFWWQRIQDGRTTGQACQAVAHRYGIPLSLVNADLTPFIETLVGQASAYVIRQR